MKGWIANDADDPTHFMDQRPLKEFEAFPEGARLICLTALTIAAEGGKADVAKPMRGIGSGMFEIALPFRAMPSAWSTLCN